MNIRALIRQTKANLQWPVRVLRGGQGLEVFSDAKVQVHTIYYPDQGSPTLIEVLRNLGHATLAEEVHPVFGGAVFEPIEGHHQTLAAVFRATSQWFGEAWLMDVIPQEAKLDLAMQLSKPDDQMDVFHQSLLAALGARWLAMDMEGGDQGLVDAFLSVRPEPRALEAYTRLSNLLLAPSGLKAALTGECSWAITEIGPKK